MTPNKAVLAALMLQNSVPCLVAGSGSYSQIVVCGGNPPDDSEVDAIKSIGDARITNNRIVQFSQYPGNNFTYGFISGQHAYGWNFLKDVKGTVYGEGWPTWAVFFNNGQHNLMFVDAGSEGDGCTIEISGGYVSSGDVVILKKVSLSLWR